MEVISGPALAAIVGLIGGLALGYAARIGRFCTLGAIEDALYGSSFDRLRMWAFALGLAILGCSALIGIGILDTGETFLIRDGWSPLASILGGLVFGYGMALSGACGYGALARLGTGDMRAFVLVGIMGVAAYATLFGPLAGLRIWISELPVLRQDSIAPLPELAAGATGLPGWTLAVAASAGLFVWALRADNRNRVILWGGLVGLAIVAGWGGTALIAANSFDVIDVRSHSFSAPVGETLLYLMISTSKPIGFAVGSVCGVVAGSILGSLVRREFRWEACEDPRELKRQVTGAVLMGGGSVLAMGCSVGQGLSAFAILSPSAPVVTLAIFAGAALGLRHLIYGLPSLRPAE